MLDLAQLLLEPTDLPREAVATPEWPTADGKLFVRQLTAEEREAHSEDCVAYKGALAVHAAWCLCDATGVPFYVTATKDGPRVAAGTIENLKKASCTAIERIADVAVRLNAMTAEYREALKKKIRDDRRYRFHLRLARQLGFPRLALMYRAMSAVDLAAFEIEDQVEPWGPERGDLQAGIVASEVVAMRTRRVCGPSPDAFRLTFSDAKELQKARRQEVRANLDQAIAGWRQKR